MSNQTTIYCETDPTEYNADAIGPCIFALYGCTDHIAMLTSANLTNLYIEMRGLLNKLGYESEFVRVNDQKELTQLFGGSSATYPHLTLRYKHDQRSVVLLYKGDSWYHKRSNTLTMEDISTLKRKLVETKFVHEGLCK